MRFTEDYIAKHMQSINGSAVRDIFKYLSRPGMISFAGGNPSNRALEPERVRNFAVEAIDRYGTNALQYGGTEGLPGLRVQIAQYLRETAQVRASADNILPVQGSSQAFDLLLKALINPGDCVVMEDPTFLGAIQQIRTYDGKIVTVATDEGGVVLDELEKVVQEHHPKLFYLVPSFQNPTGRTLALERRKPLAEMAAKYGFVIAEDDPYRDLRYTGEALPSISSFDEEGWVVYMSSFSKYIAPGLRVGAAVVPDAKLLRKMVIGKQSADVHSPVLTQAIVEIYLEHGLLPDHLKTICADYRVQMEAMLECLAAFPEGTKHTVPEGGLFVWAELPKGYNTLELLPASIEENVAFVPGVHFYPNGGHENTMRLNFSMQEVENIHIGMERLAALLKQ